MTDHQFGNLLNTAKVLRAMVLVLMRRCCFKHHGLPLLPFSDACVGGELAPGLGLAAVLLVVIVSSLGVKAWSGR